VPDSGYRIMITGIGGTGVVTVNQLVATAAFLDGLHLTGLDQTGLSQKGGPVVSHLVLSTGAPQASNAVGPAAADLFLALDLLVATDPRFVNRASADRTTTVASTSMVPTADMVRGSTALPGIEPLLDVLRRNSRPDGLVAVDLLARTEAVNGDATSSNVFALGVAYQAGALPISVASIEHAIELNGVAVDRNLAAFRAGRWSVHDPARLPGATRAGALVRTPRPASLETARGLARSRGLDGDSIVLDTARRRAAELVDYQSARLAGRYLDLVAATASTEQERVGSDRLTAAVVDGAFHLLAYKDEYEVARLHLLAEFDAALDDAIPGHRHTRYWLHPPALRALGMKRKLALPAWMARPAFRALRAMRRLRGTPFDLVGHNHVRRTERRLGREYEAEIRAVLAALSPATHDAAVELASLPLDIRGYESIKLAAVERYDAELAALRPAALGQSERAAAPPA
jgi:indolepyruvate ferredoxin oxidoreductase